MRNAIPRNYLKRRIVLPNKIAEREWRVLNSHSSKHKLFNLISIQFGACKMPRLNQLSKFSRIFDWISRIFDWLASNWNVSHLIDLDVAFYMQLILAIRFGPCKMRRLNRALEFRMPLLKTQIQIIIKVIIEFIILSIQWQLFIAQLVLWPWTCDKHLS